MTVSPFRELFFLFCSLLFGCGAAIVRCFTPLLFGGYGEKKERTRLYGKFPYPPPKKKKEGKAKKKRKAGKILRSLLSFLGDSSFFLLFSVFYCVLVYAAHDGVVRLYSLCFVVLGFWGARWVLMPLVTRLSRFVFMPLREGLFFCLLWLLFPFRLLFGGIGRGAFKIYAKIRVPFSLLCGILTKKIGEKREGRLRKQAYRARELRRAAGHPLTGARISSVKESARGKGKV